MKFRFKSLDLDETQLDAIFTDDVRYRFHISEGELPRDGKMKKVWYIDIRNLIDLADFQRFWNRDVREMYSLCDTPTFNIDFIGKKLKQQ